VQKRLARLLLQIGRPAEARNALDPLGALNDDPEAAWLVSRCDVDQGKASPGAIAAAARSYRDRHPLEPEPAPFAGEGRCRDCHEPIFRAQHRSRHARTFYRKGEVATLTLPDRAVPDPDNPAVLHEFDRGGDRVAVRTRVADRVLEMVVDYAFGSGDRGLTLVGHDSAAHPYEFRLSRYAGAVGWDVTSGQPRGKDDPTLYQGMRITADAVRRCLACHTTSPHAITTGTGPESSDAAIGCERCHGPGGRHLKVAGSRPEDLAIARPAIADAPAVVALCSQCHSPRDPELPMVPGSAESSRFQGTTFTWSRCYTESGRSLDCVDCHDPHHDVESRPARYEARCLECHSASLAPRREPTSGRPCPVRPAGGCVECHMPKVAIPMAHAAFTDHFIRVHPETR
jgi:hypothetical protein